MGNTISSTQPRVPSLAPTLASDFIIWRTLDISEGVPPARRRALIVVSDSGTLRSALGYTGRKFAPLTYEVGDLRGLGFGVQHARNNGRHPRVVIGDALWAAQDVRVSGYRSWNIL